MDLRSMLNTSEGGGSRPAQVSTPGKGPAPPPQPMPSTPIQAAPPQAFRDYSQSTQASPGRSMSHDYAPGPAPPGAFASPPPYPAPGPYAPRPAPPPLQPLAGGDVRSPGSASMAGPSPYRPTPTSSVSAVSGGYFPVQATPASPVQRHQYPPASAYPPRDSFSQPVAPGGMTGPPGHPSYMQGPPMPQTPPVGTPGGAHPYLHQRSLSTHSTPTPTSAQSQHHYGTPYGQGSPIVSHHPPPQPHEPVRHPSQPPTPLGPPLSTAQRGPPTSGSFPQPTSPYQQRVSVPTAQYAQTLHRSPPAPPPTVIPRQANHQMYDAHMAEAHRRSQSQSDRGRSPSVSPRTRLSSLPSAVPHPVKPLPESEQRHVQARSASVMDGERSRAVTPAKRKLDDRDIHPDELKRDEERPAPYERVNGARPPSATRQTPSRASTSPLLPRKKKPRHDKPPVWYHQYDDKSSLKKGNFVIRKVGHRASVNGKQEAPAGHKASRQTSPEVAAAAVAPRGPLTPAEEDPVHAQLGDWEEAITGGRPLEAIPKAVADFLYLRVIHEQDIAELASRGAHFEIEAKLGTLVDRDTNQRIALPVATECIIADSARVTFRSSMTEAQHKSFNDLLNHTVVLTDPRHPDAKKGRRPRVPIVYQHRRQIDKFYELPRDTVAQFPASVRAFFGGKQHGVKARVSYDQKTNALLAKIVKARIDDLDIHFPGFPLDCRISVNLEMDWPGDVEELEHLAAGSTREQQPDRHKDRLSYTQSYYQIDLTQVTQTMRGVNNTQRVDKEHELEIELDTAKVVEQGHRVANGEAHAYQELITGLVDNVRILASRALPVDNNFV